MPPDEPNESQSAAPQEGDPIPFPAKQAAPQAAKRKRFFAQINIVHDGKTIKAGEEMPAGFPLENLKLLVKEKRVAESAPSPTKIVRNAAPTDPTGGDARATVD